MRSRTSLCIAALLTIAAAGNAQVRHGTVGSAIGGGTIGAFSGFVIGGVALKGLCKARDQVCWPPLLTGMVTGTFLGAYAGGTDTKRVRGAAIGLGAGALGGILISSLLIQTGAIKPQGEWAPLPHLIEGAMIGAAVGSIIGGLATHGEESIGTLQSVTVLHVSF